MIVISTNLLKQTTAFQETDKGMRYHLKGTCFFWNKDKQVLELVSTDAQVLVKHELTLDNDESKQFCEQYFSSQVILPLNAKQLNKSSMTTIDYNTTTKQFVLDSNILLTPIDAQYPNYEIAIPKIDLVKAEHYYAFDTDNLVKLNKNFCYKNNFITDTIPMVSKDYDNGLTPCVWYFNTDNCHTTVVVMPRRTTESR